MQSTVAKLLLIGFLAGTIMPAPLIGELSKVSGLLEHFREHRAENASLTWWGFFCLHYSEDYHRHHQDHDHSSLPMKQGCVQVFAWLILILPPPLHEARIHTLVAQCMKLLFSACNFYSQCPPADIWHPPRVAVA